MGDWFYFEGGEQKGPVDLKDLARWILVRRLPIDVRVWQQGMVSWTPANAVAPLVTELQATKVWYATEGRQQGPIELAQLAAMIRSSRLPRDAAVWWEGLNAWVTADRLPEVPQPGAQAAPQAVRKCPYCAEEISTQAQKCKHCGEYLDPALRAKRTATPDVATQAAIEAAKKKASQALTEAIVGIFCFGIILGPAALIRASSANKALLALGQPKDGKAEAARIVGWIVTILWTIGVAVRILGTIAQTQR